MTDRDDRGRRRPLLDPRGPTRRVLLVAALVAAVGGLLLSVPPPVAAVPLDLAQAVTSTTVTADPDDRSDDEIGNLLPGQPSTSGPTPEGPVTSPGDPDALEADRRAGEAGERTDTVPLPRTPERGAVHVDPAAVVDGDDDDGPRRGLGVLGIGLGIVVGLLGGGVAGLLVGRSLASPARAAAPAGPVSPPATGSVPAVGPPTSGAAPAPGDPLAGRQRAVLVAALVDARDRVTSEALADAMGRALAEAGVVELRADGDRFDPRLHEAVDHAPTADPALDGVVAATERPGYRDGDVVVRLPQVVVHRREP